MTPRDVIVAKRYGWTPNRSPFWVVTYPDTRPMRIPIGKIPASALHREHEAAIVISRFIAANSITPFGWHVGLVSDTMYIAVQTDDNHTRLDVTEWSNAT